MTGRRKLATRMDPRDGDAMRRGVKRLGMMVAALLLWAPAALAVDPPHNATTPNGFCMDCHTPHNALGPALQAQAVACLSCHNALPKPPTIVSGFGLSQGWATADQAGQQANVGSSHSWSKSAVNAAAAAQLPTDPAMLARINNTPVPYRGNLSCAVCHDPHSQANVPFDPISPTTVNAADRHFMRYPNASASNGLCVQCHAADDVTAADTYTGGAQSHPVRKPLPSADTTFYTVPQRVAGGAQVALVDGAATAVSTTSLTDSTKAWGSLVGQWVYLARVGQIRQITANTATQVSWAAGNVVAGLKIGDLYQIDPDGNPSNKHALLNGSAADGTTGNVVCLTCHAVHYADSDSTTLDNRPGGGDGRLLRRSLTPSGWVNSAVAGKDDACVGCHNLRPHSSTVTATGRYTFAFGCTDCHDAHGTANVMLVKQTLTYKAGLSTTGVDFRVLNTAVGSAPDFSFGPAKNTGGVGPNDLASSLAPGKGPCEACHTQTQDLAAAGAQPRFRNTGGGANGRHFQNQCLACHPHNQGFKGQESAGNQACYPCHSYGMRNADATALKQGTYHHVIESDAVAGFVPSATPTAAIDGDKRCIQCHDDHPFGANRATNLNTAVNNATPVATDYATATPFGVCLSCHVNAQAKNTTDQKSDGTTATYVISQADYAASAHDYATEPTGTIFKATSGNFTVSCVKCHSDGQPTATQSGTFKFALHSSNDRRLRNPLGITTFANAGDTLEEDFCYRCHSASTDTNPGGGPAKATTANDYFGVVTTMSSGATGIFAQMQKGITASPPGPTTPTTTLYFKPTAQENPAAPAPSAQAADNTTFATNRLYLKNATQETPSAPMPTAYTLASGTYDTATYRGRIMSPVQGSAAETVTVNTANASGLHFDRVAQVISPPIANGFTWNSGSSVTLTLRTVENNGGNNCNIRWQLFRWTAANANGGTFSAITDSTAFLTTVGNRAYALTTNAAVTFSPGDKIVVEMEIRKNSPTNTGTCSVYWGGATENSNLLLPNTSLGNLPEFTYTPPAVGGAAGDWAARSMSPFAPTAANETRGAAATIGGATPTTQLWRRLSLVSPAVATATTTAAASWTINVFDSQSNANANAYARYRIYRWNADNTQGPDIVPLTSWGTEPGTAAALQSITTPVGAAVPLAGGDKIVLDLEFETLNDSPATSYTVQYVYGSTSQSNLVMPGTVTFTYANPGTVASGRHDVNSYSGIHRPNPTDETQAYISANKHVECEDCHNPHAAGSTLHTLGTNVVQPATGHGPLEGVSGAIPTFSGTNWTAPTYAATLQTATAEYQICFKCHSAANTSLATWSSNWTNVGLEFGTSNQSYHPVAGALPATDPGANGSNRLTAAQLTGGWTPGQTMYCADCHGNDAAAPASQGPHGSAAKYILKGPNTRWPTQADGTTLWTLNNKTTALGGADGLFCMNCHPTSNTVNAVHNNTGDHGGSGCIACHILVPHGGKVSRLIATNTAGLPTRYAYQGLAANVLVTQFLKSSTPGGYSTNNCSTSCGGHGSVTNPETW